MHAYMHTYIRLKFRIACGDQTRPCRRAVAAVAAVAVAAVSSTVSSAVSSTAAAVEAGAADGQEEMRTPAPAHRGLSAQHEPITSLSLHRTPFPCSHRIGKGWVGFAGLGWVGLVISLISLGFLLWVGSVHSASPAAAPSHEVQN